MCVQKCLEVCVLGGYLLLLSLVCAGCDPLDMEYAGVTASGLPGWQWQHFVLARRSLRGSCAHPLLNPCGQCFVPAHGSLGSGGPCLPLEPTIAPVSSVMFHESAYRKWSSYIPPLFTCDLAAAATASLVGLGFF